MTNYEYGNFSVSQSRFDGALQPNIVSLPSSDTEGEAQNDSLGRGAITGIGLGSGTFAILVVLALIFLDRKRRKNTVASTGDSPSDVAAILEPDALITTTQEIGQNSLYGIPQELHHNARVELLDAQALSGSGNDIIELPRPASPAVLGSDPVGKSRANQVETRSSQRLALDADKPLPKIPHSIPTTKQGLLGTLSHNSDLSTTRRKGFREPRHHHFLPLTIERNSLLARPDASRLTTPISDSLQVSPLIQYIDKLSFPKQEYHIIQSDTGSIRSTYATIFDIDDYRDSPAG